MRTVSTVGIPTAVPVLSINGYRSTGTDSNGTVGPTGTIRLKITHVPRRTCIEYSTVHVFEK